MLDSRMDAMRLIEELLDAAIDITGADKGNVQLVDRGALRIVAQRGFSEAFLEFFDTVQEGFAACGEAMRLNTRVIVDDVATSPLFAGSAAREVLLACGVRAVQSTPIVDRSGMAIGMFSTHYHASRRPDRRELRLLDVLAQQAAAVLARAQAEEALAGKEYQFRKITENVASAITHCSADLRYRFVNEAYATLAGLPADRILDRPIAEVMGEDGLAAIRPYVDRVLAGERVEYEAEVPFSASGPRHLHCIYVPDSDGEGAVRGWFAAVNDVTEHRRVELALRAADQHKDEFLAMLAHELRNPLAPIRSGVEILHRSADPTTRMLTLNMIDRQVALLVRLVDDLLDVSRVSRGRIELRRERIALADVIEQAVDASSADLSVRRHSLVVTLPPTAVHVDADGARLCQVIGNLLNNAGKFMDAGGRIELGVSLERGQAVVRVRDYGIGIPAEHLSRVFDMFTQLDSSLERSVGGLGLGLTLVKHVVQLHGGTVEAHSDGVGCGSEFVVRLPGASAPALHVAGQMRSPGTAWPCRVLVVDDNDDGARTLAALLEVSGHQAHVVHDGITALDAAERIRPDYVFLDIGLPKLNGYDVCRRIRAEPWGKAMVLVAITGYGQADDVQRARAAGFDHHFAKPVDYARLHEVFVSAPMPDAAAS
jgi:PAS domain S-box-containing protein